MASLVGRGPAPAVRYPAPKGRPWTSCAWPVLGRSSTGPGRGRSCRSRCSCWPPCWSGRGFSGRNWRRRTSPACSPGSTSAACSCWCCWSPATSSAWAAPSCCAQPGPPFLAAALELAPPLAQQVAGRRSVRPHPVRLRTVRPVGRPAGDRLAHRRLLRRRRGRGPPVQACLLLQVGLPDRAIQLFGLDHVAAGGSGARRRGLRRVQDEGLHPGASPRSAVGRTPLPMVSHRGCELALFSP